MLWEPLFKEGVNRNRRLPIVSVKRIPGNSPEIGRGGSRNPWDERESALPKELVQGEE